MKTWSEFKPELFKHLGEAVIPMNRSYGFLGTAGEKAHELLPKAVQHVKKAAEGMQNFKLSDKVISHYLDSKGGRHLADLMSDGAPPEMIQKALKTSMAEFSKVYDPNLFEQNLLDDGSEITEADQHVTKMYAAATSTEGRYAAAKRKEADRKAREEYLKKQAEKSGHTASEPKSEPKKEPEKPTGTGIYHPNSAKRMESHRAIRKMMEKPLKAKEASQKLKPHFDDERLHSDIGHFAKTAPDADMRPLVKKRMELLRKHKGY